MSDLNLSFLLAVAMDQLWGRSVKKQRKRIA
jgi:hypothetical protein